MHAAVEPDAAGLLVLDPGCGIGLLGFRLRRQAVQLVGVDLAPGMLERAVIRRDGGEPVQGFIVVSSAGPTRYRSLERMG